MFGVANNLFDSELEWRNTLLEELCANTRAQHRLRVFSPQSLRINPIATDGQINAVTDGNQEGLKAELLRLIRFENDIWA